VSLGAPFPAERLAGALAGSLALHAALLAALGALPRDWAAGPGERWSRPLRVQMVASDAPAPVPPAVPAVPPSAPAPAPQNAAPGSGTAATPPLLPPQKYYTALELDRRPQPLAPIEPVYPALALSPVGRVTLALYISETGEVDRVEVEQADATGDFAASAREAFGRARFLPGVRDGAEVKSLMRIEVRFGEPLAHTAGGQESVTREKFVPTVRVRPRK
jgi:TonB family protein